ncbi:MAG TPA: LCP family protein [Gaiellaceae bacterium]|nr:LCP family protein [Gaiellaceae bacterium]
MRTTLKRGIGRVAVGNGNGQAVLPPGALSPVTRYRQPERRRGPLRRLGMILFVLLALSLAAVSGMAGGTYLWELESLNRTTPVGRFKEASKSLGVARPNRPSVALVIGYDHRPEDGTASSRSDTLMLLRTDPTNDTVSMLSFPRDLIVPIYCQDGPRGSERINTAYFYCGPQGALETVRHLTGLPIHFLIGVNFDGFRQSVDKLGGVWLDVDRRYVNLQGGDYATINLWPGYQRLKGWQALDFVRYRHTDSDLFRLGRQQQFVKAMKQVVRHKFRDPRNVFEVVNAMTKNMQIGRAGGRGISPDTLHRYARFAYEMPAGNFFQVKIGGLTGTNELTTSTTDIDEAIAEFVHPDVEAPGKATDQVLPGQRKRKKEAAPNPKDVSLVVLNGNGQPGAAANTSSKLADKGYRVILPPEGFQANAPGRWSRTFRTKIFYQGKAKAQLAARAVLGLFNSADVARLPRNLELRTLANHAMITVIVGQTFSGNLTPTPVDRTPPKQPPYVRDAKSEVLPAVRRAAAWKVGFPLQIPTVIERSSVLDSEVPFRVYKLDDDSKTVRFTFRTGANEYWGIQEADWDDAPALEDKNFSAVIKGRQYDLYYSGPNLHMVVLRAGGASYWVVNTILDSLSNETMLEIAKGLRPMHK